MKAIVFTKYGSPDVLQLKEVEKPTPGENDVLIKVHASSINDWDWGLLRGKPFVNRLLFGLLKPKVQILGCDVAGKVEAVGKNVKQFHPGDEVFGDLCEFGFGGFAEYVCANKNALTLKPSGITFEEAAAIPQAAILALVGLRNYAQILPGQKVLINGAGGGAGSFAVQLAKLFGAEVTGVDSTIKLDFMRSIGADHVIDYTKEDFTKNGQRYDLIHDGAVYRSVFDCKRALSPSGIYIMVGGSMKRIFQALLLKPWISLSSNKKIFIQAHKPNKDLEFIKELFETGKVKSAIDRCYPLSEVPHAFQYFGERRTLGKVVISM